MSRPRLLIADADADNRRSTAWVLKEHGFDVVAIESGDAIPEQLEQVAPDLLLIDAGVLHRETSNVLSRIKSDERWRDLPVVILSEQPEDETSAQVLALGATDHIRKPFPVRELIARMHAQLRMLGALRAARDALHAAEADASRARRDAEARRRVVEILREITGDLSPHETYAVLVRRAARALGLSHCSIILAQPGAATGVSAASLDDPAFRDTEVALDRYPEVMAALREGKSVLVDDVRTSPLFSSVRALEARERLRASARSVLAVPFSIDRRPAGVFLLRRAADSPSLTVEDAEFAETLIKAAAAAIQRAQLVELTKADNARLEALAHTDSLTMVLNRRALMGRLTAELDRARRYDTRVSLLMIDLDDFKAVNDTYGHPVGDEVLRTLAQLLLAAVRSVDVVARYGGEEFVVVLPETSVEGAITFAERLRERIEAHTFVTPGHGLMLTVSVGVGSFPMPGMAEVDDLIARADEALYRAKVQGRNRVRT